MNLKQLADKNLHQWPAKVICLIIAIFLYIFHQVSLIDKKTYAIPLTVQENGNVMHVGTIPSSVSIIVRTSTENIKNISINEINASINLDTITEKGVYELPVHITLSDKIKELDPLEVRLKDDKITVEVDTKTFKYVKIVPSVVGDVAHGYEIETVSINPSTIKVTGPESIVNATDQVFTNRITVSNAETSFTVDTDVQILNKLITLEDEGPYKADVIVVPKNMEVEFNVPIELMNLSSELRYEGEAPYVKLKLFGTMNYLENYHVPRRSVQAYLGDIKEPGTYELPLHFYFPNTIEILEKSADMITVNVVNKPEDIPQTEQTEQTEETEKAE